jgi:hypothetical protein
MPYDQKRESYQSASNVSPGRKLLAITPGAGELAAYPKALRIYSDSGCTVTVVPVDDPDTETQVLEYPAGLYIENLVVRQVTAATGAPIIHGYTK